MTIVSDDVLFDLGSAHLRPEGRRVLDGLAGVLGDMPNHVAVEGHTDNTPISAAASYRNNWVLSHGPRRRRCCRYLLNDHDIPARRLSAAGYADQRPVRPNSTTSRARGQPPRRDCHPGQHEIPRRGHEAEKGRQGRHARRPTAHGAPDGEGRPQQPDPRDRDRGRAARRWRSSSWRRPAAAPARAAAAESRRRAGTPSDEATHGPVQNLEPITLNLADGHFLKVGLALQLAEVEGAATATGEELPPAKALDIAITLLGSHTMDELASPKERELVKKELSNRVAGGLCRPRHPCTHW